MRVLWHDKCYKTPAISFLLSMAAWTSLEPRRSMNARRAIAVLLLGSVWLAISEVAQAGVVFGVGPGGGNPAENVLFNQSGLNTGPAPTIMGATNQTSVVLNIDGQGTNLTIHGSGQASVVSDAGNPFGSVLFTPNGSPPLGFSPLSN